MSKKLLDYSLDQNSPVPLYHQLQQIFIESISSGELKPGDQLPSEHTLEESFHISRATIRHAMSELEREGYIYRQRGRPTLVNVRPVYHGKTAIAGFSDDVRSQGCKPWSTVLGVSIICVDSFLAERLKISAGDEVIMAHRLRLADEIPVCTEKPYLPLAKVGPISPKDIEGEKSLYQYLREKMGIRPTSVDEIVEVVTADDETASLLQIDPKSLVVRLQRTVYDDKGECMEYAISHWRTDRFKYMTWRSSSAHIALGEPCS